MEPSPQVKISFRQLSVGDPAPWFEAPSNFTGNPDFSATAGRYVVLGFFGIIASDPGQAALETLRQIGARFDPEKIAAYGVALSADGADQSQEPPVQLYFDSGGAASRLYGVMAIESVQFRPTWFVLDPMLRVIAKIRLQAAGAERGQLMEFLNALPALDRFAGFDMPVPVIALPNVFERDFCRALIELYERHGGEDSGFMSDVDGKTVRRVEYALKRRSDYTIADPDVMRELRLRMVRRIIPEIEKVHAFKCTRIERYIIGCYDSDSGGHFTAHRDNLVKGTAHRRFAVSLNLNDDFDGGEVKFPEYGGKGFKLPAGGAVVFSCSLLHAVSPLTRGRRYAFLPFLYDDAAAQLRAENARFLGEEDKAGEAQTSGVPAA